MSSLARILELARNSESPVIIYDALSDTDFVLQRGDTSEALYFEHEDDLLDDWYDFERKFMIEEMSSADLLEQINRDIAVWRAKEDQERLLDRTETLEEELMEEPVVTPIADDFIAEPTWHPAAEILEQRAPSPFTNAAVALSEDRYVSPADFTHLQPSARVQPLDWSESARSERVQVPVAAAHHVDTQITVQALSEDPPLDEPVGESEPLPDEDAPVFYEEPRV